MSIADVIAFGASVMGVSTAAACWQGASRQAMDGPHRCRTRAMRTSTAIFKCAQTPQNSLRRYEFVVIFTQNSGVETLSTLGRLTCSRNVATEILM